MKTRVRTLATGIPSQAQPPHLSDQVLEVGKVGGRLHVARKDRRPDEWDPPVERYDPYAPGKGLRRDHRRKRRIAGRCITGYTVAMRMLEPWPSPSRSTWRHDEGDLLSGQACRPA